MLQGWFLWRKKNLRWELRSVCWVYFKGLNKTSPVKLQATTYARTSTNVRWALPCTALSRVCRDAVWGATTSGVPAGVPNPCGASQNITNTIRLYITFIHNTVYNRRIWFIDSMMCLIGCDRRYISLFFLYTSAVIVGSMHFKLKQTVIFILFMYTRAK